jgi:hypothetical protein
MHPSAGGDAVLAREAREAATETIAKIESEAAEPRAS